MEKVTINTEFIKLDQFLKYVNAIESGGSSKYYIAEGMVKVNGEVCTQRGKKLRENDTIEIQNLKYVIAKED